MGDALEADMDRLIALLCREAGKTLDDGVAEVREAADFCRYYAMLAEQQFGGPETLTGPVGETNQLVLHGRGVFACISPWNFPLAIFTGQIAAALAAGNARAGQARRTDAADRRRGRAPVPQGRSGRRPAGPASPAAARPSARRWSPIRASTASPSPAAPTPPGPINRSLAARQGPIIPFIAETGGLNGMFVDTTALREQVIDDVHRSRPSARPASAARPCASCSCPTTPPTP